jgi:hypothetical protein
LRLDHVGLVRPRRGIVVDCFREVAEHDRGHGDRDIGAVSELSSEGLAGPAGQQGASVSDERLSACAGLRHPSRPRDSQGDWEVAGLPAARGGMAARCHCTARPHTHGCATLGAVGWRVANHPRSMGDRPQGGRPRLRRGDIKHQSDPPGVNLALEPTTRRHAPRVSDIVRQPLSSQGRTPRDG